MKECELYKKENSKGKNKVRCLACAHKCLISNGSVGICRTRKNINGIRALDILKKNKCE